MNTYEENKSEQMALLEVEKAAEKKISAKRGNIVY